jgi:ubiquinone/menaquinone biosynthesis C-methylase UbiE
METHFEKQDLSTPLRNPAIRQAIRMLDLPEGSNGLDAGCGIGSHTLLLAGAVGPDGHVTGLELFADFVAHAQGQAKQAGLADRISIQQGNVNAMPFEDASFDWAWSVDCVGQVSIGQPLDGLRELARVVRPGGRLAILGYSSQMLLPGYTALEARLNATASATTALAESKAPGVQFTRALGWFQSAGLEEPIARTVVGTVHAPLDDGIRRALISLFGMLWGEMESHMDDADRREYRRLTKPESPDFILNISDYYAFFTYSMFEGRVAEKEV